jgi:O-antigen/teichoic acid export membrane protein
MALMIANFLYVIPQATSQSLFAEGSYSETELKKHLVKAVKIISLLLIPTIIVIFLFGNYILLAFGKQYSNEGFLLLKLFAISGIFISINSVGNIILYIKHKIKKLIAINSLNAALILFLSYVLLYNHLLGIGLAYLIAQMITSVIQAISIYSILKLK